MKKIFTIFILTTLYFILNTSIFAVTTTISNIPAVISADLFIFDVVISGASAGTNYLRIDLFKPTTTNYFGETFNGLSWFNGSDYLQYFPITIQPMTDWIGQIQGRLGNPTVIQYDGPGTYKLKVRRYTPSGSYNTTEANNSALDIIINVPILTPTPVITPTDIPTSAPTETLISTPTPTLPAEVLTEAGSTDSTVSDPLKSVMNDLQAKADPVTPPVLETPVSEQPISPPVQPISTDSTDSTAPPVNPAAPTIPDFPAK